MASFAVGTLPNQTRPDGTPAAAKTSGSRDYGGELSYLVGQRASACTCKDEAKEHPGPHVRVGRGAPESEQFWQLRPCCRWNWGS